MGRSSTRSRYSTTLSAKWPDTSYPAGCIPAIFLFLGLHAKQYFDELAEETSVLQENKQALLREDANRTAEKQRLDEFEAFLEAQQETVTDYDEALVRRPLERITVYDDRLAFEFKCGLETEIKM